MSNKADNVVHVDFKTKKKRANILGPIYPSIQKRKELSEEDKIRLFLKSLNELNGFQQSFIKKDNGD